MYFYIRTLKSEWYMAGVCDTIFASLEGMKRYTKYEYASKYERKAYTDMFEECQLVVREHDLKPDEMLKALSDLHDYVITWKFRSPFFSYARWFYKPDKAREQAVIAAFELVDGISTRFLS